MRVRVSVHRLHGIIDRSYLLDVTIDPFYRQAKVIFTEQQHLYPVSTSSPPVIRVTGTDAFDTPRLHTLCRRLAKRAVPSEVCAGDDLPAGVAPSSATCTATSSDT